MKEVKQPQEKRLVLSMYGNIPTSESLTYLLVKLDDAQSRETAAAGIVSIAGQLVAAEGDIESAEGAIGEVLELFKSKKLKTKQTFDQAKAVQKAIKKLSEPQS